LLVLTLIQLRLTRRRAEQGGRDVR
jgi:hypothetical protein